MSQRKSAVASGHAGGRFAIFRDVSANLQNTLKSQVMMQTITTSSKRGALL
jgi:hypothetical protein